MTNVIEVDDCCLSMCCGILELGHFRNIDPSGLDALKSPTAKDWVSYVKKSLFFDDSALVIFSASEQQKTHLISPIHFAKWLRTQRQKVSETPWTLNPETGNKIKMFTWIPTPAFRKKFSF